MLWVGEESKWAVDGGCGRWRKGRWACNDRISTAGCCVHNNILPFFPSPPLSLPPSFSPLCFPLSVCPSICFPFLIPPSFLFLLPSFLPSLLPSHLLRLISSIFFLIIFFAILFFNRVIFLSFNFFFFRFQIPLSCFGGGRGGGEGGRRQN